MTTTLPTRTIFRGTALVVALVLMALIASIVWFGTAPPQGGRTVVDNSPPSSVEILSGQR